MIHAEPTKISAMRDWLYDEEYHGINHGQLEGTPPVEGRWATANTEPGTEGCGQEEMARLRVVSIACEVSAFTSDLSTPEVGLK